MCSISLQVSDPTGMGLPHVDGVAPQLVDGLEIVAEHIGVLVIFR